MQNIKKVLHILEKARKECEKLEGDEIVKAIPEDVNDAIEALYKIGSEISVIFRKLSPLREMVVSKRIKLERQRDEKTH